MKQKNNVFPPGVRARIWGQDAPFLFAMRHSAQYQNELNNQTGVSLTDCDIISCNYKQNGLKDLRSVQLVEIKSRNAEPHFSQLEAYQVFDSFRGRRGSWLNYGVSFVSHDGPDFNTATRYRWGRFKKGSDKIWWREVDRESIFDLVAMVKHPDTLSNRKIFRSHHGQKRKLEMETKTELGFTTRVVLVVGGG